MATLKKTLEVRILERGVELLGSRAAFAQHLRISPHDLALWLDGCERPARTVLLAAIEVLLEHRDTAGLESLHSLQADHDDPLAFLIESRRGAPGAKAG
jgi:hypothetical protein